MTTSQTLYFELKPEMETVAEHLFSVSENLLRKHGNFLPHAAVLTEEGQLTIVAVAPPNEVTSSAQVLPLLHDGLRQQAKQTSLKAIGVAENVTVTQAGKRPTQAIKVLVEHSRGLTVALYLPFEKRLLRGYMLGSMYSVLAPPEVRAWGGQTAEQKS